MKQHIHHGTFNEYKPDFPEDDPRHATQKWGMFSKREGDDKDFYEVRKDFAEDSVIVGLAPGSDHIIYVNTSPETTDPMRGIQMYELRGYGSNKVEDFRGKRLNIDTGELTEAPLPSPPPDPATVLVDALAAEGVIPPGKVAAIKDRVLANMRPPPRS